MKRQQRYLVAIFLAAGLLTLFFFVFGLHRKPNYIRNYEEEEFGGERPFIDPTSVENGLAVYTVGHGGTVLLFPYPHGHTTAPMAQSSLAEILITLGHRVVTFDVPGAYRSTREPVGSMQEMIDAADETLDRLEITGPVDVVGHSMSGLAALAYAIERPERVQRLVLANSVSGFPAAARCGFPGSAFRPYELNYWRIIIWGMRINSGRADMALHKKLYNLMGSRSYYDKRLFTPLEIAADDYQKGVPVRMIWSRNMYKRLSYVDRLDEVQAPTLILAGRHDPEASLSCSEELLQGIMGSSMIIFEKSGHEPFIEEPSQFAAVIGKFLSGRDENP